MTEGIFAVAQVDDYAADRLPGEIDRDLVVGFGCFAAFLGIVGVVEFDAEVLDFGRGVDEDGVVADFECPRCGGSDFDGAVGLAGDRQQAVIDINGYSQAEPLFARLES